MLAEQVTDEELEALIDWLEKDEPLEKIEDRWADNRELIKRLAFSLKRLRLGYSLF